MARKRGGLEPWEAVRRDDSYTRTAKSLSRSAAYGELTGRQIRLYELAKERRQFTIYLNASGKATAATSPAVRWCGATGIGNDCFFLNLEIAVAAGYYRKDDPKAFYRDRKALGQYGFIDTVLDGKRCRPRGKSVFRMCERWKEYTRPRSPPKSAK